MRSGVFLCTCGEITVSPGQPAIKCPFCHQSVQPAESVEVSDLEKLSKYQILLLMKGCFLISTDFEHVLEERYLIWEAGTSIAQILDWLDNHYKFAKELQPFRVCSEGGVEIVLAKDPRDAAQKTFALKGYDTVTVLEPCGSTEFTQCPPESYLILN